MLSALNQPTPTRPLTVVANRHSSDEVLLLIICTRSDEQAYRLLMDRYFVLLRQQAQKTLQCWHTAEEVVCDVFLKIWKNRQKLHISTRVKNYLHTAVRNQSIDRMRRRIKERAYRSELKTEMEASFPSGEDYLIGQEVAEQIAAAVESLPPQGRNIFRLSREEGKKYREIAEELNISVKTVETHMRRSLIQLRAALLNR
ncbi:MAG: RNA polymerase sigma-70 factor [Bacteroidota bacterium]